MTRAAVWIQASIGHQETDSEMPDVERFIAHHGYQVTARYEVTEPARVGGKVGGGYQHTLKQALEGAQAGRFQVLVVWALDRITRNGAEGALRIIRHFRQRGVIIVSVKESWLNDDPDVQDVLLAFAGWMAHQESLDRSDQIRAGLARRRAEGKHVGRQPGAVDKAPRKRAGYVASWEDGKRRAAHDAKATS